MAGFSALSATLWPKAYAVAVWQVALKTPESRGVKSPIQRGAPEDGEDFANICIQLIRQRRPAVCAQYKEETGEEQRRDGGMRVNNGGREGDGE